MRISKHLRHPPEIRLSAYEQGSERITRLAMVVSCMTESLAVKLARLHDRKGELEVTSRVRLTAEDERCIRRLWAQVGNETTSAVTFEVEGRE